MEHEIRGLTLTWLIENNAKYINELNSPVILLDEMDRTKWKLCFDRKSDSIFALNIKRELIDDGPMEIGLNYEFTVDAFNESSLNLAKVNSFTFQKDQLGQEIEVNHKSMLTTVFPDSIIIRCNIYKQQGTISKSSHNFVQTRVKADPQQFLGVFQNFAGIYKDKRMTLKTVLSQSGEKLMDVDFYYNEFRIFPAIENLYINISSMNRQPKRFLSLKFFLLNTTLERTQFKREEEFILNYSRRFTLPKISREIILKNATRFLSNGDLHLHIEITFFSGFEHQNVKRIECENDPYTELKPTNFSDSLAILTSKTGVEYDTKLQTATEAFSAHTAILSAKSPIFDAMFKTNMKEAIQNCVEIDDMEAETVYNMLVFIYLDSLEVLEWRGALNLYLAADKYQILILKNKCEFILRQSICLSNCCVLLLVANIYQDEELKRTVHHYLTHNGKYVIYSDQWRKLEKDHPQLVLEYYNKLFRQGFLY